MKKGLFISATVAALLVGCGGGNGTCCSSGFTATGVNVITTDKNGNVVNPTASKIVAKKIDANGKVVDTKATSSCTCKKALDANGKPACQPTNDDNNKCKIELIQKPSCNNTSKTLELAELTASEVKETKDKINIDSTESISYVGTLTLRDINKNIDMLTMNLELDLPEDMCGKNIDFPDGKSLGFGGYHKESISGDENKIYALLTDVDGNMTWAEGKIVGGKVIFPDVTVKLPVKISVFRATDKDTNNETGMTGSTGSEGY